jgi:uncharacterized protein (DUF1330 family)
MAIYPTPEQISALLAGPDDQPVVMVNLLRFKPQADGGEESGEAAYQRYATAMREVVEGAGGRFLWAGNVDSLVIGEAGAETFHTVGIVEYPSRRKFVEIATSARVQEIGADRAAGLESQWLIATTTRTF